MDFKEQVKKGFQACKDDISTLFEENQKLNSKISNLSQENFSLKSELSDIKLLLSSFKEEFQKISHELILLNSQKTQIQSQTFQSLPTQVNNSNSDFSQTSKSHLDSSSPLYNSSTPQSISPSTHQSQSSSSSPPSSMDPYEALLAFKAKKNKRDMLKQKMVHMVGENGMNLSELKFMLVDHFRYCSKATFYNYLKELEIEKMIKIMRENSHNIVYLEGLQREI